MADYGKKSKLLKQAEIGPDYQMKDDKSINEYSVVE